MTARRDTETMSVSVEIGSPRREPDVKTPRTSITDVGVITGNRFMVKIEGNVPNMDALKLAAGGIDLAALDRLGAAQAAR